MSERSFNAAYFGQSVTFSGPATVEEVDALEGKGACLEAFMQRYSYTRQKDVYPRVEQKIAEYLGEERPFTLKKAESPDEEDQKVYDVKGAETVQKWINTLMADKRLDKATLGGFIIAANAEAGPYRYDPSTGRAPRQEFYDQADRVLAKIAAGQGTQADSIAKIEARLGIKYAETFGEYNRESLARAARAMDEKKRQEAADDLG